jgi:hypothetical protein
MMNKAAEAHIIAATRRLDMMLWFVRNGKTKKLSVRKHILPYFDLIKDDLIAIQTELYTDDEYTESVAKGLARVSHTREYHYSVTSDNDGRIFYNVDAMLPLNEMKQNVLFARGDQHE